MTATLMSLLPKFTWDIEPTLFKYPDWLGFMPGDGIRYYSLLYVGVFLGGYKLLDWQIKRAGGSEEDASDFVLYGVVAVLGGARVGHVLFYEFDRFLEYFLDGYLPFGDYFEALQSVWKQRHHKNILLVSYEEMHTDFRSVIHKVSIEIVTIKSIILYH